MWVQKELCEKNQETSHLIRISSGFSQDIVLKMKPPVNRMCAHGSCAFCKQRQYAEDLEYDRGKAVALDFARYGFDKPDPTDIFRQNIRPARGRMTGAYRAGLIKGEQESFFDPIAIKRREELERKSSPFYQFKKSTTFNFD